MNSVARHRPVAKKKCSDAHPRRPRPRKAFTLTEMLVVLFIIIVLISLLAAFIGWFNRRGQEAVATADIHTISAALDAYKDDQGYFPATPAPHYTTTSGTLDYYNRASPNSNALFRALILQPLGTLTIKKTPYLTLRDTQMSAGGLDSEATEILDPWRRPYNYDSQSPFPSVRRNATYDLWTSGRDTYTSNRRRSDEGPNDFDNDDIGNCYPP